MADNLSPLVNLDLVNQIYRTINAQISERVYDPNYYSAAKLGDANHRYVNAYLKALNVSGDVTITGNITGVKNISATTFNNLTLKANTTGFEISGGTTSKKLKVADTTSIDKPLTISANTAISANLTVSAATKIIKELTVGADNTGTVTIKSAGAGNTTIVGPSGATAQFNVATTVGGSSANTGSVIIQSSGNNSTTIQGPSGKTAAFKVATTIGDDSNYTGAVEIKSAGTNRTTIIGPSNGTAKFLVNTTIGDTTKTGAVTIKSNGTDGTTIVGPNNSTASFLTSTTIGSSTNTGAVSIQPSGAKSLTINGPSNGEAVTLISGPYQNSAVTACSTGNEASKIVQRDSSGDILVEKVNGVKLSSASTGFTAVGGTAPRTLKVNSAATLGSTANGETGDVVVKSEGVKTTTIVGPNDGTAKLKNGTCLVEADATTVANDSKIVQRSNGNINVKTVNSAGISGKDSVVTLSNGSTTASIQKSLIVSSTTTLGAANTGSITIRSGGADSTTIVGPNNGTVTFTAPTDSAQSYVELKNANNNTSILKISSGKNVSAFSNLTVGNLNNTGSVAITPKGANALNISSNTTTGNTNTILKSGTCVVEDDLPTATVGSATTATINSWTDDEVHYLATVKASGGNQGISAETDSTKKLYIERKTVDNATTYHFYAGAVHNAVWNDLADCIEVPEDTDLEFGYCYTWNGDKVEKTSRKSKNYIGIHSNTAGLFMGEKPTKTIQTAVAGFALAYVDKIYPEGTPLTWSDNGKLTKCTVLKRVLHPERVIATFYKEEKQESWHGVKVNSRHWVKIR